MDEIFFQYGALGAIVAFALMALRVMFNAMQKTYEQERERANRLEEELRKLNEMVRTEYITTISTATRAISDALAAVRKG